MNGKGADLPGGGEAMRAKEDWEKWYAQPNPWGSEGTEKDSVRIEILLERLKYARFDRMLDLGCGEGFMTNAIATVSRNVQAFDISALAVERARARFPSIDFQQGELFDVIVRPDVRATPFDFVVVSEVLYYLQTDEERRAAVSGIAELGTPECVYYFSVIVTGDSKYRRYFTTDEFVELLSERFNIIDEFMSVAATPIMIDAIMKLIPSRGARHRLLKSWTTSRDIGRSKHMGFLAVKKRLN